MLNHPTLGFFIVSIGHGLIRVQNSTLSRGDVEYLSNAIRHFQNWHTLREESALAKKCRGDGAVFQIVGSQKAASPHCAGPKPFSFPCN